MPLRQRDIGPIANSGDRGKEDQYGQCHSPDIQIIGQHEGVNTASGKKEASQQ
jgi:hypothetical protein